MQPCRKLRATHLDTLSRCGCPLCVGRIIVSIGRAGDAWDGNRQMSQSVNVIVYSGGRFVIVGERHAGEARVRVREVYQRIVVTPDGDATAAPGRLTLITDGDAAAAVDAF